MIRRSSPSRRTPLKRSQKPIRKRRSAPRRGRVVNAAFMERVRQRGCVLARKHICWGPVTFHHLRSFGSPKDDTWGIGLCSKAHLHAWGEHSIERLGKAKFEAHWGIILIAEAQRNRDDWEEQHGGLLQRDRPAESSVAAGVDAARGSGRGRGR